MSTEPLDAEPVAAFLYWASVVSETWLNLYGVPAGMRAIPLVEPDVAPTIGIVTRDTELQPPAVNALLERAATAR